MSNNRINSLTGMRFIAILIIVVSHLEFLKNYSPFGEFYWQYIHNATIGVDFFFVLSGFGMMFSNINHFGFEFLNKVNIKNSLEYAVKHIKKIYPLYIFTMLIMVPSYVISSVLCGKSVTTIIGMCFLKLTVSISLTQSLFGVVWLSHAFNSVCWFLSCLFCIYLVSPFFINVIKKFCTNINRILFLLVSLPVFSSITAFLFSQIQKETCFNALVHYSPYRRIIYVLFGMVIAIIINKYKNSVKIRNINFYEIAFLIISILWFFFRRTVLFAIPYISLIYIFDMAVAGLIIFFLALNQGIISDILSKPKFIYLGEMSMYIFLIHYPIRIYLEEICNFLNLKEWYIAVLITILIFVFSYGISKFLYVKFSKK